MLNRFPYPLNKLAFDYYSNATLSQARKDEFGFAVASAKKRMARGVDEGKHDFMSYMLKNNDDKGYVMVASPLTPRQLVCPAANSQHQHLACPRAKSLATLPSSSLPAAKLVSRQSSVALSPIFCRDRMTKSRSRRVISCWRNLSPLHVPVRDEKVDEPDPVELRHRGRDYVVLARPAGVPDGGAQGGWTYIPRLAFRYVCCFMTSLRVYNFFRLQIC